MVPAVDAMETAVDQVETTDHEGLEESATTAVGPATEPLPEAVFLDLTAPPAEGADSDQAVIWLEESQEPEVSDLFPMSEPVEQTADTALQPDVPEFIAFRYGGRSYSLEPIDFLPDGSVDVAGEWLIKFEGRLEHTLPGHPGETHESLVERATRTLQESGAGAARELDFEYEGKIYHLEDRSASLSHDGSAHVAMWAVVCDGVMEGSFAAPPDESESVLRARAIQIARRSGQYQARLEARGARYSRPALERRPMERREADRREAPRRQASNRVNSERRTQPLDRRREERRVRRPLLQRLAAAPGLLIKLLLFPIVWPYRLLVRLIKGTLRAIRVTATRLARGVAAIFLLPVRIFRPTRRRRGRGMLIALQEWLDATPLRLLWPYLAGALVATGAITLTPNVLWAAAATAIIVLLTSAIARRSAARHPDDLDDASTGVTTLKLERPIPSRRRNRPMPPA
jgi:hypothetical protein